MKTTLHIPEEEECSLKTLTEKIESDGGKVIFSAISGSHAYSTNIPGSDYDFRGVFILPTKEVLAGRYVPQVSDELNDITYYEIGRFIELASKGNPNIQELLNMPEDMITFRSGLWDRYFPQDTVEKFITTKLKHTYTGYAFSQIKKAKGLKKKINFDKNKVVRKDVLDFSYVMLEREESVGFKKWCDIRYPGFDPMEVQWEIGLASINNFPNMYTMYDMDGPSYGIIGEDSNTVRMTSIPKGAIELGKLRVDVDAYSTHCKDYREYQEWLTNRNPERYRDNLKGEQGYDHKNMMHCMRLLNMAKDIADGKGIIVKRPEYKDLLKIRNGEMKYDDLLNEADKLVDTIKLAFDEADLPREVKPKFRQDLLLKIRLENLYGI